MISSLGTLPRSTVWVAICFMLTAAGAQPALPPLRDPLMSLMVSQPKIEIATQVVATAAFDPPAVRPGELSILRVTFNALEESVEWPARIAAPPQLEIQPGAHGQNFRMGFGKLEPETTFNSRVRASGIGKFTVPQFTVRVYGQDAEVPPTQLDVVESPPGGAAAMLILEFAETNLFVGQATTARLIPAGGARVFNQVQLNGDGIIVDPGAQHQQPDGLHGVVYLTTLTPIQAGKLSIFAQAFAFGGNRFVPGQNFGAPQPGPQFTLLESEPVELHAQPLPLQGQLPGFTGAIGKLAVGEVVLATNVLRIGDPLKLMFRVTSSGETTLSHLAPPPAPHLADWEIFPDTAENTTSPNTATFHYTMIPLAKAKATPAIPFSYFDPQTGRYMDATVPSMPVTVTAGGIAADLSALLQSGTGEEPEKQPVLSELAAGPGGRFSSLSPAQQQPWFVLVQLAPLAAMAALWFWDRRRRYLEQHPDILLRRRARRALRRQWRQLRQAARDGDAPRFAASAVSAMRTASAPHYPAEPRALVGSDVLRLLASAPSENGQKYAGDVVRRFFAVTDAGNFGAEKTDTAALLPLQPELERVLEELDQRLCTP